MKTLYREARRIQKAPGSLTNDLTRHLQRRQHLGTAVVLCDQPSAIMPVVRKQWLKIARNLQRERAATVNAQKILQLTYATTRMHHLNFVSKAPSQHPNADVFFVSPDAIDSLPEHCFSLYITAAVELARLNHLIAELADKALVVDYIAATDKIDFELQPKQALADQVRDNWGRLEAFLHEQRINIVALSQHNAQQTLLLDDALDVLLDHGQDFLRLASTFQHSLQLAQPLDPLHETKKQYATLALLAHRVQTLSTGKLAQYFDAAGSDNFFLRDSASEADEHRQLSELIAYHEQAGHANICAALKRLQALPESTPASVST